MSPSFIDSCSRCFSNPAKGTRIEALQVSLRHRDLSYFSLRLRLGEDDVNRELRAWMGCVSYSLAMSLLDVQPVVLITGISASGKSTVADLLAIRFDRGVHVKGDIFRRMIVAGRNEMTATPSEEAWRQLRLRYHLGACTADAYHRAGFSVVLQDVIVGAVLADYVAAIHSRPLIVVVLAPRPEAVAAREAFRPKTAYRREGITIAQLDDALRRDTPRIGMWIDSSDQRSDETVDVIIDQALQRGSVA